MSKHNIWGFIKELVETVVTVLVLVIIIRTFIGEPRWIPSASMRPTLKEGDRVFIEKISNFVSKPKRGDIVVFYPPFESLNKDAWSTFTRLSGLFNNDIAFIKRVIGEPGDIINIRTNASSGMAEVYINGKKLDEEYTGESKPISCKPDMYCGPMRVPANSYFMMGDNRSNSQDSRFWGFLPQNRIIGKASFIFWPLNRIKLLEEFGSPAKK
jgi:signal peptidase I